MILFLISIFISFSPTENPPIIDGRISEGEWNNSYNEIVFFNQFQPEYGEKLNDSTEIFIMYDKENLYFLLKAYQDTSTLTALSSTRDNGFGQDWIGVIIDPLSTRQEGYEFIFTFGGNLIDAQILKSNDGVEDFKWDGVVDYITVKTSFGYMTEIKIPFSNFRRSSDDIQTWCINFIRYIYNENRKALYYLPPIKDSDFLINGGISINFENIRGRAPLYVTPYGIWGATLEDSIGNEKGNAGFDIRFPVYSEGIANFAFNPDFSQLEGDPLQFDFNLRYALYYPEYRPFFKEESGIFDVESEIFYSRKIQNPFIAGRYTYKGQNNSLGVLIAYDEKDEELYNNEAYTGLFRYTRKFHSNYASLMFIGRKNFDNNTINSVLMTDANIKLIDFTIYYSVAMSQLNHQDSSFNGYFHEIEPKWQKNNYTISLWYNGISPEFVNETGYIGNNNYREFGVNLTKLWNLNSNVIKQFAIKLNSQYSGEWNSFNKNLLEERDSLEYCHSIYLGSLLYNTTICRLYSEWNKLLYNKEFYFTNYMSVQISSRILSKVNIWLGSSLGHSVDYNYSRLGKSYSTWCGFEYPIFNKFVVSISSSVDFFYADTSGFAHNEKDIENLEKQWETYENSFSLYYTPNNEISFSVKYQKLYAEFADYYWDNNNRIDEDKFFGVIEYKPSPGNVIYFGGRLPEKMIFFKFTHRFSF